MRLAAPLDDLTEKEWQRQVVELARILGFNRIYHTHDSRRSAHGFPDLVLVRDRVVYVELKRERTHITAQQAKWILALLNARAETYIARPRDLEALGVILAARETPWLAYGAVRDEAAALEASTRAEAERRAA